MDGEKKYKYADGVADVCKLGEECPPAHAKERTIDAFRWVKFPAVHECFRPPAQRDPKRVHKEERLARKCSYWGLSLHVSLETSISAFLAVEAHFPQARKLLGSWVALGKVHPEHGKCTRVDDFGHFDLHEYEGADVASCFVPIQQIPKS